MPTPGARPCLIILSNRRFLLAAGYGYEITGADVHAAYHHTMAAAERAGATDGVRDRVRRIISSEKAAGGFIDEILARRLESS